MISILELIRKKKYSELKALLDETPTLLDPEIELMPTVADHIFYCGSSTNVDHSDKALGFRRASRVFMKAANNNSNKSQTALDIAIIEKDSTAIEVIVNALIKHKYLAAREIVLNSKSFELFIKILSIYTELDLNFQDFLEQLMDGNLVILALIQKNKLDLLEFMLKHYPRFRFEDLYKVLHAMISKDGSKEEILMYGKMYGKFDNWQVTHTFNEKAFLLIFNKLGGIKVLKDNPNCYLAVALATEKYHIAKFLLSLGYNLHDTLPEANAGETEKRSYCEVILLAANSIDPATDKSIEFLSNYVNIADPALWKNFSLTDLARKQKLVQIKFLIKKLGRDPGETDAMGQTIYDVLYEQTNNVANGNKNVNEQEAEDSTIIHLYNAKKILFLEDALTQLDTTNPFYNDKKSEQSITEPKRNDHDLLHVLDDEKPEKEMEQILDEENEFWRQKLDEVMNETAMVPDKMIATANASIVNGAAKNAQTASVPVANGAARNAQTASVPANVPATNAKAANAKAENADAYKKEKEESIQRENSQTIAPDVMLHHNAVLWSLSNRHRSKYFKDKIQEKTRAAKRKEEVKKIQEISEQCQDTSTDADSFIELTFSDHSQKIVLKFVNFTKEEDYNFMVHTTSTKPEIFEKTLAEGAAFIRSTEFFSCSLLDKETAAATMYHQDDLPDGEGKIIFPLCLILDLADDAVLHAFSMDAWSPMLTKIEDGFKRMLEARNYLHHLKNMKKAFLTIEWALRSKTAQNQMNGGQARASRLSVYDSDRILHTLTSAKWFKAPDNKQYGYCPNLTPRQTLKFTQNTFNEVIVAGRPNNKMIGILVDEQDLHVFIDQLKKLHSERLEQSLKSLRLLAKYSAKYPLILVRTKPFKRDSKLCQYLLYQELKRQTSDLISCARVFLWHRDKLEGSVFAKKKPSIVTNINKCTDACLSDIKRNAAEMAEIHRQITSGKKLGKKIRV